MNRYLFDQWRSGAPPFDGYILCHRDSYSHETFLPAKELREVLNIAVARLRLENAKQYFDGKYAA